MEEFDKKVLEKVRKIPKGKITTYKEIARALKTKGYRAVGQALKRNKNKKIPCHRVICSNGSLGGYFGKEKIGIKIKLLEKEGVKIRKKKIDLEKYLFRKR